MYSVEDRKSLDNIGQFIKSYEDNFPEMKKTMILVGNKCDSDKRVVSLEEGKEMAEKLQVPFYEISVKNKENVEIALTHLVEDVKKKIFRF